MAPGMVTPAMENSPVPGTVKGEEITTATPSARVINARPAMSLAEMSARMEVAKEMFAETRLYGALTNAGSHLRTAWNYSKRAGWVLGSSALILVLPVLWEVDREAASNLADSTAATAAAQAAPDSSAAANAATATTSTS